MLSADVDAVGEGGPGERVEVLERGRLARAGERRPGVRCGS
jgi:hypothetical protein